MQKLIKPCGFHCIKMKNIGVSFGDTVVLENINLHIHCGSLTAIIGRNGAGKSTLLKAILGDIPHSGEIFFSDSENGQMKKMRIGYVPQSLNLEPNSPMNVYDLIASYRYRFPIFLRSKEVYGQIKEALAEFEADYLIDQPVGKLSGGELQRVLLSMAVMDQPNLLLLDEPVSGIDKNGMDLFYEKMDYLRKNYDMAIIVISHDLDYVAKYADKVVLVDKTVLADGSVREVFESDAFYSVFGKSTYAYGKHAGHVRAIKEKDEPYVASYKGKKDDTYDVASKDKEDDTCDAASKDKEDAKKEAK